MTNLATRGLLVTIDFHLFVVWKFFTVETHLCLSGGSRSTYTLHSWAESRLGLLHFLTGSCFLDSHKKPAAKLAVTDQIDKRVQQAVKVQQYFGGSHQICVFVDSETKCVGPEDHELIDGPTDDKNSRHKCHGTKCTSECSRNTGLTMIGLTPGSGDWRRWECACRLRRIWFANIHRSLASADHEEAVGDAGVAEDQDE